MIARTIKRNPNKIRSSASRKVFLVITIALLCLWSLLCILPFVYILAVSLSSKSAVSAGVVSFWPVDFTLNNYAYLLEQKEFFVAFGISVVRVFLGTGINLFVTVLAAYPLAFARKTLKGRRFYVALILACMFFSGGTVPTYIMMSRLGLIDNLFVLVLPGALSPWNLILFVNFFRNVPNEMLEAANIEGAGDYRILWRIVLPVSLPILATITLLCMVGHWNNWFDGYLYMDPEHWPLQTYIYDAMEKFKKLQNDIQHLDPEQIEQLAQSSDMTLRSAQIFIAMVPILCVYPFMQKYFVQGILIGSVKE